jgi:hypothetical protein
VQAVEQETELRSMRETISKVTVGLICWATALTVCIGVMTAFVMWRMRSLKARARRLANTKNAAAASVPTPFVNVIGHRRRHNKNGSSASSDVGSSTSGGESRRGRRRRVDPKLSRMVSVDETAPANQPPNEADVAVAATL